MKDDVAFQSQQFAEQVEQRRDRYAEQMQQAWNQLPQGAAAFRQALQQQRQYQMDQQQMAMAQQEHQMRMDTGAQSLASEQIRQQRARDEMQWARDLHTTSMMDHQRAIIAAQRRAEEARAGLIEAQIERQRKEIDEPDPAMYRNPLYRLAEEAAGVETSFENGKYTKRAMSQEERAAARKKYDTFMDNWINSKDPNLIWDRRDAYGDARDEARADLEGRRIKSREEIAGKRIDSQEYIADQANQTRVDVANIRNNRPQSGSTWTRAQADLYHEQVAMKRDLDMLDPEKSYAYPKEDVAAAAARISKHRERIDLLQAEVDAERSASPSAVRPQVPSPSATPPPAATPPPSAAQTPSATPPSKQASGMPEAQRTMLDELKKTLFGDKK